MKNASILLFAILISVMAGLTNCSKTEKADIKVHKILKDTSAKIYETVKFGKQIWMSKNLDVVEFRNGDPIPEVRSLEEWVDYGKNRKPAFCYYDNDTENGRKYGILYNWFAVTDPRQLAPKGFHIPSKEEFDILIKTCGGEGEAAYKTLTRGGVAGFNAWYAGHRYCTGPFTDMGEIASFWTSTEESYFSAHKFYINRTNGHAQIYYDDEATGHNVRCIKD